MAFKSTSSLALFLLLNILLCAFANACGSCPGSNRRPRGPNNPPGSGGGRNNPPGSGGGRNNPPGSGGGRNNPPGSGGGPNNPGPGGPNNPGPGGPNNPTPTPSAGGRCPRDALKLGVCANLLGGLLNITIGTPPVAPCCTLIQGLADLEAAVCLCTVIRANILGLTLNIPLSLSLLLNICSRNVPPGFQC